MLLGIDIGTTHVKAAIMEADTGMILASSQAEYPLAHPKAGTVEQNPDDWWEATILTVQAILEHSRIDRQAIRGIGLSGQMHGTVCLDQHGNPLRPAIIWADQRSYQQVQRLETMLVDSPLRSKLSGRPATGFMIATLMWFAEHEPDTLHQAATLLLPKDYVRYRLTEILGTDISDASATGLVDIEHGTWFTELIELCNLETHYLPTIHPSDAIIGQLAIESLGLPKGIPVIAGCADQTAQALGYSLVNEGTALITIGTGGQVFHVQNTPTPDPKWRFQVFTHAIPQRWYAHAAILSGGLSLRWLRDMLGLSTYEALTQQAEQVGSGDLLFLPYLAGERTPHHDPKARGVFVGMRLHHGVGHLARAVMEGVTFAMAECLSLIEQHIGKQVNVIVSGGATHSRLWLQLQADIYQRELMLVDGPNQAILGAALLAGVGCGVYRSFDEAFQVLLPPQMHIEPNPQNSSLYAERFEAYRELYGQLKEVMHTL